VTEKAYGEIFNVGSDIPVTFLDLVKTIIKVAKQGSWNFAEFSAERKAQEPGDFYSDVSKIGRIAGWQPTTNLEDGLSKTIEFYRKYKDHYWQTLETADASKQPIAAISASSRKP
jgi:nucleoside-diphosphate-sugar epimerase